MQALMARKERESGSERSKATQDQVYNNAAYVPDLQGKHFPLLHVQFDPYADEKEQSGVNVETYF